MLYEQSNAIRVDCVIFQSVSALQPDGKHVMNMKRCLRGLLDCLALDGDIKSLDQLCPTTPFNPTISQDLAASMVVPVLDCKKTKI